MNITQLRKAHKAGAFNTLTDEQMQRVNEWLQDNRYEPVWADYPLAKSKAGTW